MARRVQFFLRKILVRCCIFFWKAGRHSHALRSWQTLIHVIIPLRFSIGTVVVCCIFYCPISPPPFPIFSGSSKCSFQSKSFYAFMKRIWHFTYFPLFRTSSLSLIKIPQLLQQLSYFINLLPLSTPFGGKDRCLNPLFSWFRLDNILKRLPFWSLTRQFFTVSSSFSFAFHL